MYAIEVILTGRAPSSSISLVHTCRDSHHHQNTVDLGIINLKWRSGGWCSRPTSGPLPLTSSSCRGHEPSPRQQHTPLPHPTPLRPHALNSTLASGWFPSLPLLYDRDSICPSLPQWFLMHLPSELRVL
ncbi:hypothetical protein Pmani_033503 [Petrolisthes manimaculis]|uniref:Uncharacterized protein n=1 Tax=Petrolisthes manimaculis TaxID=1843537 RepID=A0AAE1TQL4_9EUCA|nr:hypothetical protein Pmani_033503 [Petrolisthes manimaculis]